MMRLLSTVTTAGLLAVALPAHGHEIKATAGGKAQPAFEIVAAEVKADGNALIFRMDVKKGAGTAKPAKIGKTAGAPKPHTWGHSSGVTRPTRPLLPPMPTRSPCGLQADTGFLLIAPPLRARFLPLAVAVGPA